MTMNRKSGVSPMMKSKESDREREEVEVELE